MSTLLSGIGHIQASIVAAIYPLSYIDSISLLRLSRVHPSYFYTSLESLKKRGLIVETIPGRYSLDREALATLSHKSIDRVIFLSSFFKKSL